MLSASLVTQENTAPLWSVNAEYQLQMATVIQALCVSALLCTLNPTTIKLEEFALLASIASVASNMHVQVEPTLRSKVSQFAINVLQAFTAITARELLRPYLA